MFADNPVPSVCLCGSHFISLPMVNFTAGVSRVIKCTDYILHCCWSASPQFNAALPWKNKYFDPGCSLAPCKASPLSTTWQSSVRRTTACSRVGGEQVTIRFPYWMVEMLFTRALKSEILLNHCTTDSDLPLSPRHVLPGLQQDPPGVEIPISAGSRPQKLIGILWFDFSHHHCWSRNFSVYAVSFDSAPNTIP